MPRMGFRATFQTRYDQPVLFVRGEAKLVSCEFREQFEANSGDSSLLSQEFFDTLRSVRISRNMFKLAVMTGEVREATEGLEILKRQLKRVPVGNHFFVHTYLEIGLSNGFRYQINLGKGGGLDHAGAMSELLQGDFNVSRENHSLTISVADAGDGFNSLSEVFIEVLHSSLVREFERRKKSAAG